MLQCRFRHRLSQNELTSDQQCIYSPLFWQTNWALWICKRTLSILGFRIDLRGQFKHGDSSELFIEGLRFRHFAG